MVELCELHLNIAGDDHWPADLDAHVAELDFDHSSSSLYCSSSAFNDTSLLSTDSLDSDQLRAACQPSKADYQLAFSDSVCSTSSRIVPPGQDHQLTTWGRIRSSDPLDENTNSLPVNGSTPSRGGLLEKRPSSLLATFQEHRREMTNPDYEYSELYVGDGRYVDVNENEIGFVPSSTAGVQLTADRWRTRLLSTASSSRSRRTFVDLEPRATRQEIPGPSKAIEKAASHRAAPELEFLRLPHQMGALCRSAVGIDELIERVRSGVDVTEEKIDLGPETENAPDSGLGASGPTHIEDWQSLSILLPSIERPRRPIDACRNCFGVRRRLHPPRWAHASRRDLCDCTTSQVLDRPLGLSMRADELAVLGMPVYRDKRSLVEAVVEAVAGLMSGSGEALTLIQALQSLIGDGLRPDFHIWTVVVAVTGQGPATKNIYSLVVDLDKSEKSFNSRVSTFFKELISLRCLDCWLSYVVLKQNILKQYYDEAGFVMQASGAYRSLLHRLVETLECLSVGGVGDNVTAERRPATRLAADSRVPKSSSVPSRLSPPAIFIPRERRASRIPLPGGRRLRSLGREAASRSTSSSSIIAQVREDVSGVRVGTGKSLLAVSRGERVRVLTSRGMYAHCARERPRRAHVQLGLVHRSNLILSNL